MRAGDVLNVVAFDTETKGLDWFEEDQRAFLASWADARGEYHAVLSDPAQRARFESALRGADVLVAHNLSFDVHQVRATMGLDILGLDADLHDTDLMSRVLFPEGQRKDRGGHGLKNLATVYVDPAAKKAEEAIQDMGKQIGLRTLKRKGAYYEVWRAFPDVMEHYARMDARYTLELYKRFLPKLDDDPKLAELYALEREVAPILIRAEARGVRVDPAAVDALHEEYTARERELHAKLDEELGAALEADVELDAALAAERDAEEDDDPKVGDALREALLKLGVPLYRMTKKTGKLSTNKFALQEFEDDFPVIAALFEWRRVSKFLSTYIEPMRGREVVHPSFQQAEAWTGRMSCRRPNMQNLPKNADRENKDKLRSMFVPREGYKFVVCDYESIEVRLLAWYLGRPEYRQLIRDGHDPHAYMASVIWGGAPEDYAKGTPGEAKRAQAKNTMFAITYGAGKPRVTDMNNLDPGPVVAGEKKYAAAKQMISTIKAGLPGYHRLMSRIRGKIEAVGHVRTILGRKQIVAQDKAYVGLNALIQGSAADIMKRGLVNVAEELDEEMLFGYPLLVVHDEVVVEVPEELAKKALSYVARGLREAYDLDPPLEVSGDVVSRYGDA